MNNSEIVNRFHGLVVLYLLGGWILESQRKYLVFILPGVQFQFLINNNMCILTQLEKELLIREKKEEEKEIKYDSFTEKKLKEYNINLSSKTIGYIVNGAIYGSFLMSYYLM